jgi:formamidopyrimidine-DNA glycosylase
MARTTALGFTLLLSFCRAYQTRAYRATTLKMVEGHSVHRVAALHRKRLVGKSFTAWSPNKRFSEGANAISGKKFSRIEAVGKNLFAFFGDDNDPVVMHVHFGMAGNWAVYFDETPPEPTSTNRLRLECPGIIADLSAMTVQHGGIDLYRSKRSKLGEDPLRDDANPDELWERVKKSNKSIGALVMDQSYFTGPGNIYRAEILFKASVHPDIPGKELEKSEFDLIWHHTVALLKRGFETGSILTVDPDEALSLGKPNLRRYIYNSAKCPRCHSAIKVWEIANRKCYACPSCQPRQKSAAAMVTPERDDCVPFNSHCARESASVRLKASGPSRLTVKEIKSELVQRGVSVSPGMPKAKLVELLEGELESKDTVKNRAFFSPEEAAAEKAAAGENLAVEHIAELAPGQARRARAGISKGILKQDHDLTKLTVAKLKKALRHEAVSFSSKTKKSDLIELLQNARQGIPDDVPSSTKGYSGKGPLIEPEKSAEGNRSGARVAVKREAQTSSPTKTKRSRNPK